MKQDLFDEFGIVKNESFHVVPETRKKKNIEELMENRYQTAVKLQEERDEKQAEMDRARDEKNKRRYGMYTGASVFYKKQFSDAVRRTVPSEVYLSSLYSRYNNSTQQDERTLESASRKSSTTSSDTGTRSSIFNRNTTTGTSSNTTERKPSDYSWNVRNSNNFTTTHSSSFTSPTSSTDRETTRYGNNFR